MASTVERFRDKWDTMTNRERGLVVALAATFVICILAWVAFDVRDGLASIEAENRTSREALTALNSHRARVAAGAATSKKVEIPEADKMVKLDNYLERIIKDIGLKSPNYPTPKEEKRGSVFEVSIKLTIRNITIYELKDLLEKIETQSPLVVVRELHIKRNFRDKEKLDLDFTVATYKKAGKGESDEGEGS